MIIWLIAISFLPLTAMAQPFATNGDQRLEVYLADALERHPALTESRARYRSALQRIPQATALPDPMLGFTQFARNVETRVGPQTTGVTLSQRFPWFGKLAEKGKVAAKEAEAKRELVEVQKAEIVRQVKRAYYDLAYLDRATSINEEERQLLGHFETLAQARYVQGVGLQQAVLKLQAELTRNRNRLEVLRQQRVDTQVTLNTLLDQPPETPLPQVDLRIIPVEKLNLESLYEKGRREHPELRAALVEIEKNEKRIHAARKEFWPDVTVGGAFLNIFKRSDPAGLLMPPQDNGKNAVNFTVGINLPIQRRRRNAAVLEATEDFLAAREGYRQTTNAVEAAVRSVAFRLETLEQQLSLFEKVLLPQAEQSLRSTEAAYASGTLSVLELLDSERLLLEVRLSLEQFKSEYMKELAEMERAIGSAFPEAKP